MLLIECNRKCLLALILLLSTNASAQSYDEDHHDDDHLSLTDGSDGPDYSKYYSVESPGPSLEPLHLTDHINPSEFASFFNSPSFFAASDKQEVKQNTNGFIGPQDFSLAPSFGGKDYFEEAAEKQKAYGEEEQESEEHELHPGTSYISHKVIPSNHKSNYASAERDGLKKPLSYTFDEDIVIPLNAGSKQSVGVSKYEPQYKPKNPNNLTPYQKYSFQPTPNAQHLHTIPSASTYYISQPRNPAIASRGSIKDLKTFKPSQLLSECKKVNKHVPGTTKNAKPMDCYICKDAQGVNYEECSYASASNPQNYYVERSKQYSTPGAETFNNYRPKRYTDTDKSLNDPYEYIKKRNEMFYDAPDFGSAYNHPKSFEDEYKYGGSQGETKSATEQIAAELLKSGENCIKEERAGGLSCTVCQNKKSGTNYEQCSYTAIPTEKKYAFAKESKYSSANDPKEAAESEEEPIDSKKPQQFYNKKQRQTKRRHYADDEEAEEKDEQSKRKYGQPQHGGKSKSSLLKREQQTDEVERIKPQNTNRQVSEYTIPKHFSNIQAETESESSEEEEPDHADYFYNEKLSAPRHTAEKGERVSKDNAERKDEEYGYYGEESQRDVEKVLAEFARKDRSKCKKADKNGMTCYLCEDMKGHQHEECMYVSESRPQSTFQAYHAQTESDRDRTEGKTEEATDESKVKSVQSDSPQPQSGKDVLKKGRWPIRVAEQQQMENESTKRHKRSAKKPDDDFEHESEANEDNDQYRVGGERGAFSHETDPVFSKKFGTMLPKFMLTRSEGERIYDQLSKSKS